MILPLRFRNRLMGVLTLISPFGSQRYRPSDRIVTEDLARRCALALENARLYREMVAERDKAERASRAKDEFVAWYAIPGPRLVDRVLPVAFEGLSSRDRNEVTELLPPAWQPVWQTCSWRRQSLSSWTAKILSRRSTVRTNRSCIAIGSD